MSTMSPKSSVAENWLFLRRWLKHPLRVGAVAPISESLALMVGQQVQPKEDHYIVELGGGTGQLTRGLIAAGLPMERTYVVEIDPHLYDFLQKTMPNLNLILGDATNLASLLPPHVVGKVSSIVSGIPLFNMSFQMQKALIEASMGVLAEGGEFIQYAYAPVSPLPAEKFGLTKERLVKKIFNFPPASIWRYRFPAQTVRKAG